MANQRMQRTRDHAAWCSFVSGREPLILRVLWLLAVSQLSAFSDTFPGLVAAQLIFAIRHFPLCFQYVWLWRPSRSDAGYAPPLSQMLAVAHVWHRHRFTSLRSQNHAMQRIPCPPRLVGVSFRDYCLSRNLPEIGYRRSLAFISSAPATRAACRLRTVHEVKFWSGSGVWVLRTIWLRPQSPPAPRR